MRLVPMMAVLAITLALGSCSKCDVPTFGWAGPFGPSACSTETPRR
jgi:hypothetical protein